MQQTLVMTEVFDRDLYECFLASGVREEVLKKLEEDELCSVDLLDSTSDELLRACGVKGGQIIFIRRGLKSFKETHGNEFQDENIPPSPVTSLEAATVLSPSSPLPPQRLPLSSTPTTSSNFQRSLASIHSTSISPTPASQGSSPNTPHSRRCIENTSSPVAFVHVADPETPRQRKNWVNSFQLPTMFSPAVSEELSQRNLSTNRRNEFTRDICTAIRVHTTSPSRTEREHISLMIIRKYPFLSDSLGTGIGSWTEAIRHRFNNLRKTKRPPSSKSESKIAKSTSPKSKKRRVKGDVPELPAGETNETCTEHTRTMKREMQKISNKNLSLIKELMELTYAYRREKMLTEPVSVKDTVATYPALQLVSEFKAEFGRVVGDEGIVTSMSNVFKESWEAKILLLGKKKTVAKDILAQAQEEIMEEPDKKPEIEEAVSVVALQYLIKDRGPNSCTEIIKICSNDEPIDRAIEKSVFLTIVTSGKLSNLEPVYIAAEGMVVCRLCNMGMATALSLLVACYYIFNIEYPSWSKNFFLFLETILMDNCTDARKRVTINKFLKELNFFM